MSDRTVNDTRTEEKSDDRTENIRQNQGPLGDDFNLEKLGRNAGGLISLLAVLATTSFALGYCLWSVHGYCTGTGPITPSQPQAIATGIWIFAMLVLVVIAFRIGASLPQEFKGRLLSAAFFVFATLLLTELIAPAVFDSNKPLLSFVIDLWLLVYFYEALLVGWTCSYFYKEFQTSHAVLGKRVLWALTHIPAYLAAPPAICCMIGITFNILCNIPQEFGGLKPRIAKLSLVAADLTLDEKLQLLPTGPTNGTSGSTDTSPTVVTSRSLEVISSDADNVEVALPSQGKSQVFELDRPSVKGIDWLGYQ